MNGINGEKLRRAEEKAAALLAEMTLEEKLWQLFMEGDAPEDNCVFSPARAAKYPHGLGGIQIPVHLRPRQMAEWVNDTQKWFRENTRLGIPPVIFCESLHGVEAEGCTIFPQAIALGSTFDPALIGEMAHAIGVEARTMGISQSLAPDLDLARDPRWGRVEETYGEDSYLTARMGEAYIKGLQAEDKGLANPAFTGTIKHFSGHGSPESGVNLAPVCGSERELRERFLPPFEAAVRAGVLSVMPAYSEYDGTPCHSSHFMLTELLRDEWDFKGYTFSDYGGINMVYSMHCAAEDLDDAALKTLYAGMDTEAPGREVYGDNLLRLVEEGRLPVSLIDRAVRRILRVKALLGLFEAPFSEPDRVEANVGCAAHKSLARRIAGESTVLLKNDGVLPFGSGIKKLALIGPNADSKDTGDYTRNPASTVTLLEALRLRPGLELNYAEGCSILGFDRSGFSAAREAVLSSDAAVIVVGGRSFKQYGMGWGEEKEGIITCGEGFDYSDLKLSGLQEELAVEMAALGKPTVVILLDGRPSAVGRIVDSCGAMLCGWYPGEQGGLALADILFGDVNPSGKLPVTFPKSVGQLPMCYDHKPSARGFYHRPGSPEAPGRDYVFEDTLPLFPFGHGLSYTSFEYSDLTVTPEISVGEEAEVALTIKNTGDREGVETILLFLRDVASSVTTPVKRLRRFTRVSLKPGQSERVTFRLGGDDLSYIGLSLKPVLEKGRFEVMAGELKASFLLK